MIWALAKLGLPNHGVLVTARIAIAVSTTEMLVSHAITLTATGVHLCARHLADTGDGGIECRNWIALAFVLDERRVDAIAWLLSRFLHARPAPARSSPWRTTVGRSNDLASPLVDALMLRCKHPSLGAARLAARRREHSEVIKL